MPMPASVPSIPSCSLSNLNESRALETTQAFDTNAHSDCKESKGANGSNVGASDGKIADVASNEPNTTNIPQLPFDEPTNS